MSPSPKAPTPAAEPAAARWTPEQAAEYAARRDFRLAQLLAKDRRAAATARRVGLIGRPGRASEPQWSEPVPTPSLDLRYASTDVVDL